MSVKREHARKSNVPGVFRKPLEKEYYDFLLVVGEDRFPLLEEVRGKIVLFSRFGGPHGIQNVWKDNTTFDIDEKNTCTG